jgi:hypothetical protein
MIQNEILGICIVFKIFVIILLSLIICILLDVSRLNANFFPKFLIH